MSEKTKTDFVIASKWPQLLAAFSAGIGALAHGAGLGWTSTVLPYIVDCKNDVDVNFNCTFENEFNEIQGSWIGSTYTLGCMISGLITGTLLIRFGRKNTLIIMALPAIIGWTLLTLIWPLQLENIIWFYIGRILTGIGSGSCAMSVPVYIMEICEEQIRGPMGIIMQLMLTIGNVFVYAAGAAIHWQTVTLISAIFPIITLIMMLFMRESPYFLLTQGKNMKAASNLQWFRGKYYNITQDLNELQIRYENHKNLGKISLKQLFQNDIYIKPFILMLSVHFFQQFSGVTAVVFYLTEIFIKAGLEVDNSLIASAIVGSTQFLSLFISIVLVERIGRRVLLITSSSLMFIAIFSLGAFFYLDEHVEVICNDPPQRYSETTTTECIDKDGISQELLDKLNWLPLTSLIIYKFSFALGYGCLPWMMLGEFFQPEAKEISSAIVTTFNWTCSFIVTKFSVNLENAIGTGGLYFFFSFICFMASIFVMFVLPETKGKSPEDMKNYYQTKTRLTQSLCPKRFSLRIRKNKSMSFYVIKHNS